MFTGPRLVLPQVLLGIVCQPQLDRVHLQAHRQLVHGCLQSSGSRRLTGRPLKRSDAQVHVDHLMRCLTRVARVQHACLARRGLQKIFHHGSMHNHIVLHRGQPAVRRRGQLDVLHCRWSAPHRAPHLRPFQCQLHRLLHRLRRHRRQNDMGPRRSLAAKSASGIRALHVHVVQRNPQRAGDRHLVACNVLGRVIDVQLVAFPPRQGGMRLHGIVMLKRRRIGLVERDACLRHSSRHVPAGLRGRLPAGGLRRSRFVQTLFEIQLGLRLRIRHPQQLRRVHRLGQRPRHHDGDRLAVIKHLRLLQHGHVSASGRLRTGYRKFRCVEGCEHGQHPG